MITGMLKSKIDKLWLEFWASGITSPLTVHAGHAGDSCTTAGT